ncbi:MAG: glucokinase [Frankiaceae bacterium]|jgi:predicted NBD/HSP70 family sugar kinase|nr:glucokinase [Frankiaceae bacterium]
MSNSYVVGLDQGGTAVNATVLADDGTFLVGELIETPSRVTEGPDAALAALTTALDGVLEAVGLDRSAVSAVGLDTPGPASAEGRFSSRGSTNFGHDGWRNYDIRGGLAQHVGLPVTYTNDGNAAALYAHQVHFGTRAPRTSSMSAIVGTGLGGGLVQNGQIISGAAGMAGEVGHVHVPTVGLLEPDQPLPSCNCGFTGDAESIASLTGIRRNLLPYWLGRFPGHPLADLDIAEAAKQLRDYAERGDELASAVFRQQAKAIGALFTIVANVTDPHAFFLGGGVVEAGSAFRDWFLDEVRDATRLRDEQQAIVEFALVPDRDMAGARGAALAALAAGGAADAGKADGSASELVLGEASDARSSGGRSESAATSR